MESMSSHYLKNMFKSWTMDDLIWQRDVLGASEREILDVKDEIKRREQETNEQNLSIVQGNSLQTGA